MHLVFGSHGQSMGAAVLSAKHQDGSPLQRAYREMRDAGDVLMRQAQAAGVVRADVALGDVLRMMHGIVIVEHGQSDDPERRRRMFDLVLAGLRADPVAVT
jgi:hypothetical protein